MNEVFRKLQYKDQTPILVTGAPSQFQSHLDEIGRLARVATRGAGTKKYSFVLSFVRTCAELAKAAPAAVARLEDDGLLWFAYPKKSSRLYDSDIGRDDSWQPFGDLGFEGVRMIAIDEDWSALRLRRVEHIKSMKRAPERAISAEGRRRARR